ncbi:hypothetical protein BS47DRAFT_1403243 [Hydnum rufescens UP504]|uniref:Uncharacterized protein n=1 Tax=Hydnum rufescens UP504 TaxID=1448309 RepID=A0A9P6DF86_9AGAM|nr:hypothetical protein BS47DRAFT_1403243 [Hydnum rufescens UP504]
MWLDTFDVDSLIYLLSPVESPASWVMGATDGADILRISILNVRDARGQAKAVDFLAPMAFNFDAAILSVANYFGYNLNSYSKVIIRRY